MGVKLKDLIVKEKIDFSKLSGKIIVIDAPNIISGLLNFVRKNASNSKEGLIIDHTMRPISHLYGILYRINFYYQKRIFPIFCFDGRDSELKRIITKDVLNDFRQTYKWYKEAISRGDKESAKQIVMSREFFWQNIILESKQLLGALGVPYLESPASAESQCAQLVKEKIANYSNSQDYDSLLFGCPIIIQDLSKSLRRKVQGKWTYQKIAPHKIDLSQNLKMLGIDQFQLVDLGLLIGSDYFPGIQKIGPKIAYNLIKKYKNIENIIQKQKEKYDFSKITPEIIYKVRKIFLLPEVLEKTRMIFWNTPDRTRIVSLLCEDHHLNKERVFNNLEKTINNYHKCLDYFKVGRHTPKIITFEL